MTGSADSPDTFDPADPARTAEATGATPPSTRAAWRTVCERCGDSDCERHLLARVREGNPDAK
jgi:hypothetical protein